MDVTVAFKIPLDKREQLQALADRLGQTLSGYVRMIAYEKIEEAHTQCQSQNKEPKRCTV